MKKHASFIIALAACSAFLAAPVLAADAGAAKPAHHRHHKATPAAGEAKMAPSKHHHKGKHGKLACGDYAYQSAEWNSCHK